MGRVPCDVAPRDQPDPEGTGQSRPVVRVPQATPRPQEAPPQATERGQGQTRGYSQAPEAGEGKPRKNQNVVYDSSSTKGWEVESNTSTILGDALNLKQA